MKKVAVVGLGYVGLPVAVAFGKKQETIGFDVDIQRINHLKRNYDVTGEVNSQELKETDIFYTNNIEILRKANFYIVAVPTPVDQGKQPDLTILREASKTVGMALQPGDIVVYESTVYPGATEEDCLPILELYSGLKGGIDFKVGYSPERINPGDKEHTFTKIRKIVSGQDPESREEIAKVYESVVEAGVYRAESIKVAEAAKVIENTQRDLNIALMNELALIFNKMEIDTASVLKAAETKWNFLPFRPGLVGGHCIGVDPYYLTYKAQKVGYTPQVILSGRRINDGVGHYIATQTIKEMIKNDIPILKSTVTIMGITFKENCPDIRNSRVVDIIKSLKEYGVTVQVCDPMADSKKTEKAYGFPLIPKNELKPAEAVIFAVAHTSFRTMETAEIQELMCENSMLIDVKGIFDPLDLKLNDIRSWRL